MQPMFLMIKPVSGSCNMRCVYCFYADEACKRETSSMGRMTSATAQAVINQALDCSDRECTFAFQGGEPTLAGLDFFRDFANRVKQHPRAKQVQVHYVLQTNGLLLDKEWATWLKEERVLVGVSLDGPKEYHDRNRVDAEGRGTFNRVMASIHLLQKHGIAYNVLCVVNSSNARHAKQLYDFYKKNDIPYHQYIECLDPVYEPAGRHPYSLLPSQYAVFLKDLFDAWYRDMSNGRYVYNRYFENLMMILAGMKPESCSMRGSCDKQWVIEADGSVYPCDFYALDEWKIGNITTDSFEEMDAARAASGFIQWSEQKSEKCESCKWYALCRGGCRRNREPVTANSIARNYFCEAYQEFFDYAYPRLREVFSKYYRRQ